MAKVIHMTGKTTKTAPKTATKAATKATTKTMPKANTGLATAKAAVTTKTTHSGSMTSNTRMAFTREVWSASISLTPKKAPCQLATAF